MVLAGRFGTKRAPPGPGLMLTLLRSRTRMPGGSLKTGAFTGGADGSAAIDPGGRRGCAKDEFDKSESVLRLGKTASDASWFLRLLSISLWSEESSPPRLLLLSSVERSNLEVPNRLMPDDAIETGIIPAPPASLASRTARSSKGPSGKSDEARSPSRVVSLAGRGL